MRVLLRKFPFLNVFYYKNAKNGGFLRSTPMNNLSKDNLLKLAKAMFEKSFANTYITPEAIKTDLITAVAKMMTDYKKNLSQHTKER